MKSVGSYSPSSSQNRLADRAQISSSRCQPEHNPGAAHADLGNTCHTGHPLPWLTNTQTVLNDLSQWAFVIKRNGLVKHAGLLLGLRVNGFEIPFLHVDLDSSRNSVLRCVVNVKGALPQR